MRWRKKILLFVFVPLFLLLAAGVVYAWQAFPIISGYGAKNMASAIFLQHRTKESVLKEDLKNFPLSFGSYAVNEKEGSVTGSVLGFATRKAIYRKGLGCTLINSLSEKEIRAQQFRLPSLPSLKQDSLPWPYGDKVMDSIVPTIDKPLLQKALHNVINATHEGQPAYTRAAIVVYDGQIVGEQYATGVSKNMVMLGWSVSKSLTGALIGVLVQKGLLKVDAPAPVPEWNGTPKATIHLKHLLQQTSGLDFEENYAKPSEVTNMLFKHGDMAAFTASQPLAHEPGTYFSYSSGNSNILSRIIRHTVGEKEYAAFPYQQLFHKINMYSMLLEPDASGTYIGSSYSYGTARDFARFGLLYYNNGIWNGEQILPANWVQQTVQPSAADPRKRYGFQFWLNGYGDAGTDSRWYPDVPADMFFASGYGGQNIFIIPSKKLVVVRLGQYNIDENLFLKEVIQAIKD